MQKLIASTVVAADCSGVVLYVLQLRTRLRMLTYPCVASKQPQHQSASKYLNTVACRDVD
jgi:hypothetical protein